MHPCKRDLESLGSRRLHHLLRSTLQALKPHNRCCLSAVALCKAVLLEASYSGLEHKLPTESAQDYEGVLRSQQHGDDKLIH
eukprot:5746704-Amphidinium_carterae.1